MRERENSILLKAEDVLSKYGVENFSSEIFDRRVEFSSDHAGPLSIKSVVLLPAKELLKTPLRIMEQGEKLLTEKKGPRRRNSREIGQIRSQSVSRKGRLLNEGPGEVLASIAANPGRKAKWSTSGLVGAGTEWQEPERSEVEWWKWFYDQFHSSKEKEKKVFSLEEFNILHAVFVVRSKQKSSGIDPVKFMQEMEPFLDPELGIYLTKITKHFSQILERH